jgi:hypothetical protein
VNALVLVIAVTLGLSVAMTGARLLQRRTRNGGWADAVWTFAHGTAGVAYALVPLGTSLTSRQVLIAPLLCVGLDRADRPGIHLLSADLRLGHSAARTANAPHAWRCFPRLSSAHPRFLSFTSGEVIISSLLPSSEMRLEKRALQIAVAVGSLVPISAGLVGVLRGPGFIDAHTAFSTDIDAHFRYLSGLLLGIGIAYLSAVPGIERRRTRFLLLGSIVVVGGFGRLLAILSAGSASPATIGALAMELLITPAITFWALRVV